MSNIKVLQQQIAKLEQDKSVHEKELSKHHRHGISNLVGGDAIAAMG